ncbi:MAG: glycosyltransferase family 4 protein [Pseudanabaenales cyanobacterium]|nr:glycosyltransferase family 4 protein [Pseudanabaenales cyanobacterium]
MKTLQIGLGWLPEQAGGLNRFFYDSIRYLPAAGVEMRGLVAGSADVEQSSGGQVQIFAHQESSLWERCWRLRQAVRRILAEQKYALVVSHFALYAFPVLDQLSKQPLVVHFHGSWALEDSAQRGKTPAVWLKWALEQITYRQAASFIVLSQPSCNILHRNYQIPLERIHIVPGGVDTERFDTALTLAQAREKLGWPQDRPIILAVSRLMRRKGLENLIQALNQVRNAYPDVLLLIAGKGPLESALKTQIEELGLTDHARLLGVVHDPQLSWAYRAAEFLVVPSVALEGFGLITVESLAAGTPVLGTPVGGIPEILQPFSEELVMAGSSVEHLTQGILEALSGQRKLPSSHDCQTYVREHYAWPVVARQLKSVYQAVLDAKTL